MTQKTNSFGVTITDKSCLIMDEVDGMSAGDRGGVAALNAMIKKSKVIADHFRQSLLIEITSRSQLYVLRMIDRRRNSNLSLQLHIACLSTSLCFPWNSCSDGGIYLIGL